MVTSVDKRERTPNEGVPPPEGNNRGDGSVRRGGPDGPTSDGVDRGGGAGRRDEPDRGCGDSGGGEFLGVVARSPIYNDRANAALLQRKARFFTGISAGAPSSKVPIVVNGKKIGVDIFRSANMPLFLDGAEINAVLKKAISKVVPATVKIEVDGGVGKRWSGSGFIMDHSDVEKFLPGIKCEPNTYFVHTNHHVANEAKSFSIKTVDGRTLTGEVVKLPDGSFLMDKEGDTAIIMVKSVEPLPTAKIAPTRSIEMGDIILTAGYPLGLDKISVTMGIVSQLCQEVGGLLMPIQIDAAINPGNSGGPLFNLNGEIEGTNTFTFKGTQGMNYSYDIREQLKRLRTMMEKAETAKAA